MVGAVCSGRVGRGGGDKGAFLPSPQASCLCGSAPCILCGCCPSSRNSTISRLIFTFFLFLGVLVSLIMLSPGVESQLHRVSSLGEGRESGCAPEQPGDLLLRDQAWGPS